MSTLTQVTEARLALRRRLAPLDSPGDATMSVEAICWALTLAPVPADRGGQPSSACKFVLTGLAGPAGPDGTGAFPSVATLVRDTGLAERTVRTCLDRWRPRASSRGATRALSRPGSSAPTAARRAGT